MGNPMAPSCSTGPPTCAPPRRCFGFAVLYRTCHRRSSEQVKVKTGRSAVGCDKLRCGRSCDQSLHRTLRCDAADGCSLSPLRQGPGGRARWSATARARLRPEELLPPCLGRRRRRGGGRGRWSGRGFVEIGLPGGRGWSVRHRGWIGCAGVEEGGRRAVGPDLELEVPDHPGIEGRGERHDALKLGGLEVFAEVPGDGRPDRVRRPLEHRCPSLCLPRSGRNSDLLSGGWIPGHPVVIVPVDAIHCGDSGSPVVEGDLDALVRFNAQHKTHEHLT